MKSLALLLLFLAGIGSIFGAIVLAILSERRRPVPPSDDVSGDVAHLPEGFLFHGKGE